MTKKARRYVRPHPFEIDSIPELPPEIPPPETRPIIFPWLTLEWLLYSLIIIAAVALRLWNLSSYPLSDVEAQQSLLALALYHGDLPTADYYSALLASLNWLAFMLLGSSDMSARLATVILGLILVLVPATMRRQLGARMSLVAAALLAISPTAIFLSRTLNSEIGVAAGSLMVISGFFNWVTDQKSRWLLMLAVGLALMLAAGSMAFSMLIVFGLIIFLQYSTLKTLWNTEGVNDRASWQRAGIFFVIALVVLSTAALFNLVGISMLTGALSNWLSRFSFTPQPDSGFNAVFLLTIYEPLIVFAGLAGLAMTLVRRNLMMVTFSAWFVGLLLLDVFMFARPTSNVILLLVPLAFLAASALAELWEGLEKHGAWQNEGLILAAGLAIIAFGYLGLTAWVQRACGPEELACQYAWLQSVAALLLFLVVVIAFWFLSGGQVALRGAALTGVVIALLATISIGWRLSYGPLMALAYQPLAGTPASTGLVMLRDILSTQSAERVGDTRLLDIALDRVDSPSLRWQLRDYRHLHKGLNVEAPASAIITPPGDELGLAQPYLGQNFTINAYWTPVGLPPKALAQWLIFRQGVPLPEGEEVILWLRATP